MEVFNKIRNKIAVQHSMFVYNIKNVLLNGVASSIFTPPFYKGLYTKLWGTKSIGLQKFVLYVFVG